MSLPTFSVRNRKSIVDKRLSKAAGHSVRHTRNDAQVNPNNVIPQKILLMQQHMEDFS